MKEKTRITVELAVVAVVICVVIILMRFESLRFSSWETSTFVGIPLLVAIFLNLPASELGLTFRRPLADLRLFGLACLVLLPPFVLAFFLYEHLFNDAQITPRFPPSIGGAAVVHVLYFALPEELLFRGYMQKRLGRVFPRVFRFIWVELPLAGIICAALFALAHVAYDASPYRILVFFPALVFAWLRYRTGSILAPVLFHGTCNMVAFCAGHMFVYVG